jgi:hypothetical protein
VDVSHPSWDEEPVGNRVPVFGPSGGYIGHYPAHLAGWVKAANDAECEALRGRGGHWYTPQEIQAMHDRGRERVIAFLKTTT